MQHLELSFLFIDDFSSTDLVNRVCVLDVCFVVRFTSCTHSPPALTLRRPRTVALRGNATSFSFSSDEELVLLVAAVGLRSGLSVSPCSLSSLLRALRERPDGPGCGSSAGKHEMITIKSSKYKRESRRITGAKFKHVGRTYNKALPKTIAQKYEKRRRNNTMQHPGES